LAVRLDPIGNDHFRVEERLIRKGGSNFLPRAVPTCIESKVVMAGHSRLKDGVASLAYDPAIHDEALRVQS
jgi:hypothetical protein